jgi:hypothetical protein
VATADPAGGLAAGVLMKNQARAESKDASEAKEATEPSLPPVKTHFGPDKVRRVRCPGCFREFELRDRSDVDIAKTHLKNRGHGTIDQLVPL